MKKVVARWGLRFLVLMAFLTLLSWTLYEMRTPQVLLAEPRQGSIDGVSYECVLPKESLYQEGSHCYLYIVEDSTSYFYPVIARRVEVTLQAMDDRQAAVSGIYTRGLRVARLTSRPLVGSAVPITIWEEEGP